MAHFLIQATYTADSAVRTVLRVVTGLFGGLALALCGGFLAQAAWATGLWPYLDNGYEVTYATT
jgi:hypothetical protein